MASTDHQYVEPLIVALDDSGTHQGSDVSVLAGFIGLESSWADFEYDWEVMLAVHEIPHYRSSPCAQGTGPFSKLSPSERQLLHLGVVTQIRSSRLMPVGVSAWRPDGVDPIAALCECYRWIVWTLGTSRRFSHKPIRLVIENSPDAGRLSAYHAALMEDPAYAPIRGRFSGPEFRAKTESLYVQAADVMAYELYVDTQRRFYTPTSRDTRRSWQALCDHSDRTHGLILHLGRPDLVLDSDS
jgi:hypothetical protein